MNVIRRVWFRLRALVDRPALDSELDAEMQDHIERETSSNVARGMSPIEARRAALAAFGGIGHFKEETRDARGARWFDAIRQDTRHAIRSLVKSPGFTATVVITLALGVGANAAVYSVLQRIYLREPAGISHGSELRRIYTRLPVKAPMNGSDRELVFGSIDYPTFAAMRDELQGSAELALYTPSDSTSVGHGDDAVPARESFVSNDFFSTLGIGVARGRFFAPGEAAVESNPGVVVISYALWARVYGGAPEVVGRSIEIGGRPFVVIGIAADGFTGLELNRAELFLPLGAFVARANRGRPWFKSAMDSYFRMVARVPHGDDRQLKAISTLVNRRFNADDRGQAPPGSHPDTLSSIITGPIIAALGPSDNPKEYAVGLRIAGIAAIVLLIACANIANLLLVRGNKRRHEVAIRLALGVSRARLATQFLIEGIVLATFGGVAAILVAAWGGTALRQLILPTTHWATPAIDLTVLGFTLAVALATGIAAACLPTLEGTRVDIVKSLKPGSRGGERSRSRVRTSLLAAQTALSLVLLAGAGLFVRSLQRIHSTPFGYAADELAFVSIRFSSATDGFNSHNAERMVALPRAAERIASMPGVVGVALAGHAPLLGGTMQQVWKPEVDSGQLSPYYNAVSPEFFTVTGVRILAGRSLGIDDRHGGGGAIVVNSAMAKQFWPGESALGKCLIIGKRTAGCSTVVGISEDEPMMQLLDTKPQPQYFIPLRAAVDSESTAPGAIIVRTRGEEWRATEAVARSELLRFVPTARISYNSMMGYLEPELRPFRLGATLFTAFGLLALVVAAVGVYGVIAYSFSQRTHELGVRAALGATSADAYRLVLGEALRLTAIGVAAGIALSLALGRIVASLLYQTSAKDPVVIVGAAALIAVASLAASLLPAWRAALSDPMTALRSD